MNINSSTKFSFQKFAIQFNLACKNDTFLCIVSLFIIIIIREKYNYKDRKSKKHFNLAKSQKQKLE